MMNNVKSVILTVFLLLLTGCSDSRTVTTAANDNGNGDIVVPTGGNLNAVFSENGVLASSYDQDYTCYDSGGAYFFSLGLYPANATYVNNSYSGDYSIDGVYLDVPIGGEVFYNTYDILMNTSLDFFQARNNNSDLISCITIRHQETDKVDVYTTINCPSHGTFVLDTDGHSSATDSYANNYDGTYYANMKTGEFLLHYMAVDGDGNIGLFNFPAQVRSMNVIDVVFSDGTEQCSY